MTSLAYGRGKLFDALVPDWLEMPLGIVFLGALAVAWIVIILSLNKTRRARGEGWGDLIHTLVKMSRSRKWR
ncbi:hypothetical protein ACOKM5_40750 [Streptomyces sp. BH097]|uniref:hypothetical protein n=1 Tax=unclassified Streptomyces TaxID=2593676 RepID=UPI003BB69A31